MLKFHIITFGCQMNVSDSEMISGILSKLGYQKVNLKEEADLILINTCAVREKPETKVYNYITELKALKRKKPSLLLGICGCVAQKEKENIIKNYPFIDLVFGPQSIGELPELLEIANKFIKNKLNNKKFKNLLNGAQICGNFENLGDNLPENDILRESNFKAFVTIMRGCNNFCSYCVVPYTRGREKSRDFDTIIHEIHKLIIDGYKEITLLGQNVNSYNSNNKKFHDLLKEIDKIDGKFYIRFTTSHPKDLSDELIDVIANSKHIAPHIHLPVQSGSTKILKLMNRNYTREHYINLIDKIKSKIPHITLTTDVIAGFPQETDDDFNETISLLEYVKFDSAFLFYYSERDGTAALNLEGVVPLEIRLKRLEELIKIQTKITTYINKQMVGEIHEGLVENISPKSKNDLSIRTFDNHVVIAPNPLNDNPEKLIGKFVTLEITKGNNYVLNGKILNYNL